MSVAVSDNVVNLSVVHRGNRDLVAHEAGNWSRIFTKPNIHPFDEIEWKLVDSKICKPDGTVVFEQKNVEVPSWWSQNTIDVVADKYLRVINGTKETSVKQMFTRVTATIRNWAQDQNYFNSPKDAQIFEEELTYALLHQYGAFNSPVWFNLGIEGRKQAASACFISGVEDTLDGIIDFQKAEATIFRGGSGSGANLSNLRSSHEKISSGSYTSGPMSWMKGLDQFAGAMKSGGSTRNAAKMVVLDVDHPDILETRDKRPGFIRCKAEAEKLAHDLVSIGYSHNYDDPNGAYKQVPFQNANNSVSIPDTFMQAMLDDGIWQTKERKTGKPIHSYKARELWTEIAKAAWTCGDPGIQFTDTLNKWHTIPKSGRIRATNPCFHPDTRVATEFGLVRIEDLYQEQSDKTFQITTCHEGQVASHDAKVFPTGVRGVIEVHTRRGRVLKVTPEHQLMTRDGWVEAQDLNEDSTLILQSGEGVFTSDKDNLMMWYNIAGWLAGDGYLLKAIPSRQTHEVCLIFGRDDKDVLALVELFLNKNDISYSKKTQTASIGESPDYIRIHRKQVWDLMSAFACEPGSRAHTKRITEGMFRASKEAQLAFLSGYFSADGTIHLDPGKSFDARFCSASLDLLRDVQQILLNLGVNSTIYQNRRSKQVKKPFTYTTVSGEVHTYESRQHHELVITGQSLRTFRTLLDHVGGLFSARKQEQLDQIPDAINNYGRDRWTDEVVKVVDNNETVVVYDITEPVTSSLVANGIVAHNCGEYTNVDDSACNLCAINLTKFFDGRKFVPERFEQATRLFSTSQMAIVAKADYPTDAIRENSLKLRPIGTNYGDLGALIMNLGFSYDSDEGRAVAARMASLMTGIVYRTSAKLAARIGAFADFEKNREDMLQIMKMHKEADSKIVDRWHLKKDPIGDDVVQLTASVWDDVIQLGEIHGYSVCQASLEAPLGTISFLMGMSTTGVEPAFSLVSYKSLVGGGSMKLVNSGVREALVNLGYSAEMADGICKFIVDNDTIEGAPGLKDEHLPVFDCAMPSKDSDRYLSPLSHIKMMAAIQPLITCAISKTVNLPESIRVDEIAKIYEESWRLGLKCIALYRDKCKASQPLATKSTKDEQANQTGHRIVIKEVPVTKREKLPADITGWRHEFNIDGYKGYLQVNEYPDGRPGEMFLRLGKSGSAMNGLTDSLTKMCSIGLQYGIPLSKLVNSFSDTRFEPHGMTQNKDVRFAKSIVDYVFRVMARRYGISNSVTDDHSTIDMSKETDTDEFQIVPIEMKSKVSLDGPPCNNCGGMTHRNGSCFLCGSCGNTTGCS